MAWILRLVEQKPATEQMSGQSIYMHACSACHGRNMQGSPPEFPSLVGLSNHLSESGVRSLVSQGSGRMPSFAELGDEQLHAVIDYVYRGIDASVKGSAPSPYDMKFTSDGYNKFLDSEGYPAIKPPWGTLNAINLDTGKIDWTLPLGEYPELAAKGLKQTGSENYGGPVLTAGGLLFIGATNYDKKFRAFDKDTGKLLWETTLSRRRQCHASNLPSERAAICSHCRRGRQVGGALRGELCGVRVATVSLGEVMPSLPQNSLRFETHLPANVLCAL
jgi:quinoprotein glucose dehydrogenase